MDLKLNKILNNFSYEIHSFSPLEQIQCLDFPFYECSMKLCLLKFYPTNLCYVLTMTSYFHYICVPYSASYSFPNECAFME